MHIITESLFSLRKCFNKRGFDLRFVGGAVRDTFAGLHCKDVDLCTNATPDEQLDIYKSNGYRYVETGLQHGTVTVMLDNVPYEITSLRVDVDTDGRHATVEYTRDWVADLARRDLTINAMSMTFDGELIDPFSGRDDLCNGIVRFVGNPVDRIREDYLRILRWFRFQGRFGKDENIDDATLIAIKENKNGLKQISSERIWSEIKRMIQHSTGPHLMSEICKMDVASAIGFTTQYWNTDTCCKAQAATAAPEILMAAGMDWQRNQVIDLARKWKWSNAESEHADWLCCNAFHQRDLRKLIAVDGAPREWVAELAHIEDRDEWSKNALVHWEFPEFPVNGNDLLERGMKGKAIGVALQKLKNAWAESGYTANKQYLMGMI